MMYDLNIAWSSSATPTDLTRTLTFASFLGYNTVALNHVLPTPVAAQVKNPIPKLPTTPTHPESTASVQDARSSIPGNFPLPTILRRATVTLTDPAAQYRLSQVAQQFDIVAVRPTNERTFLWACQSINDAYLISLDLASSLPFKMKPKPCMTAVNRGMRFEVCYAQMLNADTRGRSNFIGNFMNLVRATKGRGLIVSSEARGTMGLRGPADLMNLLAVWGLSTEKGKEALGSNPRGLVMNEGIKRRGFRGVVDIVQVAEKEAGDDEGEEGFEIMENSKSNKRKSPNEGQQDGTMGKRQTKKQRALAKREGKTGDGLRPVEKGDENGK